MIFVIELAVLLILFFTLRHLLRQFFRVRKVKVKLSEESRLALQRYHRRFYGIYFALTLVFTALFWFVLNAVVLIYHQSTAQGLRLAAEELSLLLPALLLGLLLAHLLARSINDYFQKDGLGFFLEELREWREGFSYRKFRWVHIGITLILVGAIVYAQFNTYLQIEEGSIQLKTGFDQQRTIATEDLKELLTQPRSALVLYSGDTIYIDGFRLHQEALRSLQAKKSP